MIHYRRTLDLARAVRARSCGSVILHLAHHPLAASTLLRDYFRNLICSKCYKPSRAGDLPLLCAYLRSRPTGKQPDLPVRLYAFRSVTEESIIRIGNQGCNFDQFWKNADHLSVKLFLKLFEAQIGNTFFREKVMNTPYYARIFRSAFLWNRKLILW